MGIDIAGGADIAVPQPLLNFLQAHAIGVKQACAAVPKLVEVENGDYGILKTKRLWYNHHSLLFSERRNYA